MTHAAPICPYCQRASLLVTGKTIYPHRPDLVAKKFWQCAPCDAYVGCHPPAHRNGKGGQGDGTTPLGRLANAELRKANRRAHDAFDPLWQARHMSRQSAYKWLAEQLGISPENCHIGMMDVEGCNAVVAAVESWRMAA